MILQPRFLAGAPDKFRMATHGGYELIKRDRLDLRDLTEEQLEEFGPDAYFLSASEDDILYAATLGEDLQKRVMLPHQGDRMIHHADFVPKNSKFYKGLSENTPFQYEILEEYEPDEFNFLNCDPTEACAYKVTLGSGSHGVAVINPNRIPQVGAREQYQELTQDLVEDIVSHAKKRGCKIIKTPLAYTDLNTQSKYNLNFIMRNGELVIYKWEIPDNDSTNWDHGVFVRDEYTDNVVNSLVEYMKSLGITDGIFGVDGYCDYHNFLTLIEMNFRQENCMFTFEAYNIDFIDAYLNPENYSNAVPYGSFPYVRYWRCAMNDLKGGINE